MRTASTSPEPSNSRTLRSKLWMSCSPPPARSIGFPQAAVGGRPSRSRATSSSERAGSSRPAPCASAAAMPPCPPPSASTASRRPRGAGLAVLDRQEHDGLAGVNRRGGRGGERATVAEVLDVQRNDLRAVVRRQLADEVRRLEIGLIAKRDEAREAEPGLLGEDSQLEREVAALRDEPDPPGRQRVRHELELRGGVEHAQA